MALIPAKCPICGALLEVETDQAASICTACQKPFITNEAIQLFFSTYPNITLKDNTPNNDSNTHEFIINNGTLDKYKGSSRSITVPNSVTIIGSKAFSELTIESVLIPNTVREIKSSAFCRCAFLTEITIPSGVRKIGQEAFKSCLSLKKVYLSEGVEEVCQAAFSECKSLEEIYIPSTIKAFGETDSKDHYHSPFGFSAKTLKKVDFGSQALQKQYQSIFVGSPWYDTTPEGQKALQAKQLRKEGRCPKCGSSSISILTGKCKDCGYKVK